MESMRVQTRRALQLAACFLLLSGLAAVLIAWLRPSSYPSARLPDGTALTLKKITYGTNHVYFEGNVWERLVNLLPPQWAGKLGRVQRLPCPTGTPALVFWFRWEDQMTAQPFQWSLVDEGGRSVDVFGGNAFLAPRGPGRIQAVVCSRFPRHSKTLRLWLWRREGGAADTVAEFKVANPRYEPIRASGWQPETLPATRRVGQVEFTLVKLKAVPLESNGRRRPPHQQTVWVTFETRENGRPTTAWAVDHIQFSDQHGESFGSGFGGNAIVDGQEVFPCSAAPWSGERAWKLQVTFVRRSDFAPEELWTLRGIPLSATNAWPASGATTNLQNVQFAAKGFLSPPLRTGWAEYGIAAPGLPQNLRMRLVRAQDDRGRPVALGNVDRQKDLLKCGVFLPRSAQSIDITVGLSPDRVVEFIAPPPPPTPPPIPAPSVSR
jgi:hypothetical protein